MRLKDRIAFVLDGVGVTTFLFYCSMLQYGKQHIRVVNYHGTPVSDWKNFEAQLKFYQTHYSSVSLPDLESFFSTQTWPKRKPGLILSFDDGYRNNMDVARPLLEKYNFIGWFFVPVGLIESDVHEQAAFAGGKKELLSKTYPDGRLLMSWEEIGELGKGHVIGCHTFSHHRMNVSDSDALLTHEISVSKQIMENKLGRSIPIFCWVGGEEHTYTNAAAQKIKSGGYKFSFMTNSYPIRPHENPLQIQRTNIESDNPLFLVRFQLSSLMDLLYVLKRRRVNRITEIQ